MSNVLERAEIKMVGGSWVIRLPKSFNKENKLPKGTQVLLTVGVNENIEAEVLPPLSKKVANTAKKILKKRSKVFEELKRLGD